MNVISLALVFLISFLSPSQKTLLWEKGLIQIIFKCQNIILNIVLVYWMVCLAGITYCMPWSGNFNFNDWFIFDRLNTCLRKWRMGHYLSIRGGIGVEPKMFLLFENVYFFRSSMGSVVNEIHNYVHIHVSLCFKTLALTTCKLGSQCGHIHITGILRHTHICSFWWAEQSPPPPP